MHENELLKSRITDLAERAYTRSYTVYSAFLSSEEISVAAQLPLPVERLFWGGYENAERCMAAFGDSLSMEDFPICCIEIAPLQQKFADALSHRDFLGALMNLGIERDTLGDIIVDSNIGYLMCAESMAPYITENLTRVKHTTVSCRVLSALPQAAEKEPTESEINVASERADAVICAVYHLSRTAAKALIAQDKVFVNHKAVTSGAQVLKDGDTVSVRGYGKFRLNGFLRNTRKKRMVVSVAVFQ